MSSRKSNLVEKSQKFSSWCWYESLTRSSGAPEMGPRLPWCSVNRNRRGGSSKSSSETSKYRIYRPTFTANKHSSGTEHSTNPNINKNARTDQCVKKYVSYSHFLVVATQSGNPKTGTPEWVCQNQHSSEYHLLVVQTQTRNHSSETE